MKKLILVLGFFSFTLLAFSQTYEWQTSHDFSGQSQADTIYQSLRLPDVSSFCWTLTISTDTLNSTPTLDIGGSNKRIDNGDLFYFEGFESDSLPFAFDYKDYMTINDADTMFQKTFSGGNVPFGFRKPRIKITKGSTGAGVLYWNWLFFK